MGAGVMRVQDWPERLHDFMARDHVFDWATCNCALFAADAVLEMTGVDFAKAYRGPKTKRGMINRLHKLCGGGVEDVATQSVGQPMASPLMAKRGDVVSYDFGEGPALGVCIGSHAVFVSEHDGVVNVPCKLWRKAWSVD